MAGVAKHQRLTASGSHDLHPIRFFAAFILVQVLECSDMMNLDLFGHACCSAHFADLCEKPFFQFRPNAPCEVGSIIGVCLDIPDQRDCTPGCDQWFLFFAWDSDLQDLVFPLIYFDFSSILFVHLSHRSFVLTGKRFHQRLFHDPFELV